MDAPPNLSHLQWRAPEWLLAYGPLNRTNILDYFILSPFYDRNSSNAQLRMQMMFSRGDRGMEGVNEEEELKKFVGLEFGVKGSGGKGLWVIQKRWRNGPREEDCRVEGVYYVLNDSVFMAPSLYTVLNERLLTSLNALSTSLELLQSKAPQWTPETLYSWDIRPPPKSSLSTATPPGKRPRESEEEEERPEEDAVEEEEESREGFNPLLFRAIQSVAATLDLPPPPPVALPQGIGA